MSKEAHLLKALERRNRKLNALTETSEALAAAKESAGNAVKKA